MSKPSKRAKRTDLGGVRDNPRNGVKAQESPKPSARPGTPTTRYEHDPLGGNKLWHRIAHKHRLGHSARRIANHFGIPVAEVKDVLRKAGQL